MPPKQFLAEYWQRRPLLVRAALEPEAVAMERVDLQTLAAQEIPIGVEALAGSAGTGSTLLLLDRTTICKHDRFHLI